MEAVRRGAVWHCAAPLLFPLVSPDGGGGSVAAAELAVVDRPRLHNVSTTHSELSE